MHYSCGLLFHTLPALRNLLPEGQKLCWVPRFPRSATVTLAIFDLDNTLIAGDSDNL